MVNLETNTKRPTAFGQRLKLARKKGGLSMQRLADQLDPPLSTAAISKYENDKIMPSLPVMVQLSRVLGTSIDFLMAARVAELKCIEFRKGSRTTAQDRAMAEAIVSEKMEDYLAIEAVLDLPPRLDQFGEMRNKHVETFEEAEALAVQLRKFWRLGLDPIPSMSRLLEDKGIRVIEADLTENVDCLACNVELMHDQGKAEVVVISRNAGIERKRFNLARELAYKIIVSVGANIDKEKAIHRFIEAFLVPADHLRETAGIHRTGVTYREIKLLKQFYGVSAIAMLMRLKDLNILQSSVVKYAFRTYARTWRHREPGPIKFNQGIGAFERPSRFDSLVWRALGDKLISPFRASQFLKKPLINIEQETKGPQSGWLA